MTERITELGSYILGHLQAAAEVVAEAKCALVAAAIWHELHAHFGVFWATSPLVWLCLLWGLDFLLGSYRALRAGEWSARRALLSAVKLATWACVLSVGHALRQSHLFGGGVAASGIDAVVLLSEASSVLLNAGEVLGNQDLSRLGRAFGRGSHRAAKKAADLIGGDEKAAP